MKDQDVILSAIKWVGINLSPHQPVLLSLKIECVIGGDQHLAIDSPEVEQNLFGIEQVRISCISISNIKVPEEHISCDGKSCHNDQHMYYIDPLGDDIVQSCLSTSQAAIPKCKVKRGIPKWTEMGKPAHDTAMFWHSSWLSCGKPNNGCVWEIWRRTRAQYHNIVKDLNNNDSLNRIEKMAYAIIANDNRNFWREARKINPKTKTIPNTIDGVKGTRTSQNCLQTNTMASTSVFHMMWML